jgi:hypothetical protein
MHASSSPLQPRENGPAGRQAKLAEAGLILISLGDTPESMRASGDPLLSETAAAVEALPERDGEQ